MQVVKHINDEIINAIKFRYYNIPQWRYSSYTKGMQFLDTSLPNFTIESMKKLNTYVDDNVKFGSIDIINKSSFNYNGFTFSEFGEKIFGLRRIRIEDAIKLLGYTKTDIRRIVSKVYNVCPSIIFAGVGGVGSNLIHWFYELMILGGKPQLFSRVSLYDEESYDVSNLLRIPFIPEITKIGDAEQNINKKVFMVPEKYTSIAGFVERIDEHITPEMYGTLEHTNLYRKTYIIGAPTIESRTYMSQGIIPFIATTHNNLGYNIIANPAEADDLVMEGYGKIELFRFFINMLQMSIDILEILGDGDIPKTDEHVYKQDEKAWDYLVASSEPSSIYTRNIKFNGYKTTFVNEIALN